ARQWLMSSAAHTRALRAGGSLIYGVTLASRLTFAAAIALLGGLAIAVVANGDDCRIALMLAGFCALCVFALPGRIVLTPSSGIATRRWYTRMTRIPWREVTEVTGPDKGGNVTVRGANGQRIIHTCVHVDGAGFRREVLARAPVSPSVISPV